ncbi:MAG: hypothetical protein HQM11_08665 [SAR324 cluster bacterium]|nr:hypothetical protein [SAR324 cluster bacterium]
MMRYFFDVDGVVLDFESRYIQALKQYFNLNLPDNYQPQCWYFSDILKEEQVLEGWEKFISSEEFGALSPLVEVDRFNRVFGGLPVHFITNIPPQYLKARETNLLKAGFQFHSVHCGGFLSFDHGPPRKKADIIKELLNPEETVFFMDDHPDNCVNVHEMFPDAEIWLITRSFNTSFSHPAIKRADHWDHIFDRFV